MRKKTLLTACFILVLFLIAIAEACFVKFAQANPYLDYRQVPPPTTPKINISFPEKNKTLRNSNKLRIGFNTTIESKTAEVHLWTIYYKASWQQDNITVYKWNGHDPMTPNDNDQYITAYSRDLSLTEIPEGKQTVKITVRGKGNYVRNMMLHYFYTVWSCTVGFTIDTTPPKISLLHLENETYETPDVPINFTVNEQVCLIRFSLDGQKNATFYGNTSLTGLASGKHNITLCIWDKAGNLGVSETKYFSISEPEPETFPTTFVASASAATVAVVGAGFLVYRRKRRRKAP